MRLRVYFQRDSVIRNFDNGEPFRSELYSSDQMDRHGKILAGSHKLQKRNSSNQLLKRVDDNEKTLLEVRNLLVENIRLRKPITPGAEWLLDNFYLIEEQVVIARKHLPKGYRCIFRTFDDFNINEQITYPENYFIRIGKYYFDYENA